MKREDNIKMDIKEPGCEYVDRIRPVPNWILKGALLNMTMKIWLLPKVQNFLTTRGIVNFPSSLLLKYEITLRISLITEIKVNVRIVSSVTLQM